MDGWIKLHRKLMANPIFSSEKGLKVWIWCLMKANHEGKETYVGREKVRVKTGQFLFGREKAAEELEMAVSTVRNWMQTLKQDRYVDINSASKYSVVTVLNWNEYQAGGQVGGQQVGHQLGQIKATTKNDKNDKNEKNGVVGTLSLTSRQRERLKIQYPHVDFEKTEAKFKAWQKSNGRRFANTLEAFRVWLIEDNSKNKPREAVII